MSNFKCFFEMGQFDIKLLDALESGGKIPEGIDYQQGERYLTATLREAVFQRDNYTCRFCGNSTHKEPNLLLEIDHIIPVAKGGCTVEENLQTLCWKCNRQKSSKII